ncbi:helix-turn-helix domain-containing protein [Haloprofundus halobius]|uniref:helix-turn-helix domain-containing protein n=1 Tax=Haloprofundus halobius TaxID=2876194 RepID=UPI001CCB4C90|nr:helix-turn-helix domain-containing protein [Haloprofundus halobius]
MSVIADFSVPADAFCLAHTLKSAQQMAAELDLLVAHSPDYIMPFLRVVGNEWEQFETILDEDPTVDESELTDSFSTERLYQIKWSDVVSERLRIILDHEGVILDARGSDGEWRMRVRFESRNHFSEFINHFEEEGQVTLHQLFTPTTSGVHYYALSEKQRSALLTAYNSGYFDVPRKATGEDLAEQLSISHQAVSDRLRRGMKVLIEHTLARDQNREL